MTAAVIDDRYRIPEQMKRPLAFSLALHVAIVVLAIVGLPYIRSKPIELAPIPVELVAVDSKDVKTDKPPARKILPKNEAPSPPQKPSPPKMEQMTPPKLSEPAPPKLSEDLSKPLPSVPMPKPEEVKKPPPPPKEQEKPKEQSDQQQESFSALLRNLTPHAPTEPTPTSPTESLGLPPQPSPLQQFAQQVSGSELDVLRQQLAGCWSIPAGAKYAEGLQVEIRLFVNPDRSVRDAQVLDTARYNLDPAYRTAAESAVRAVYNPQCNPLNLPPDKYDQWKVIDVVFDPKDMLQ